MLEHYLSLATKAIFVENKGLIAKIVSVWGAFHLNFAFVFCVWLLRISVVSSVLN